MGHAQSRCAHLGVELVAGPAPRGKKEVRGYYLKFDLTKASIAEVPDLLDFYKATGAIRASIIIKTQGAWDKVPLIPVTYSEDVNWYTIKIPSIDGTELWIVPQSKQSDIEAKLGFGKASEVLVTTSSKTIYSLTFRDPLFRSEVKLRWKNDIICTSLTGTTLLASTQKWNLEQIESLKDLGSFAFED